MDLLCIFGMLELSDDVPLRPEKYFPTLKYLWIDVLILFTQLNNYVTFMLFLCLLCWELMLCCCTSAAHHLPFKFADRALHDPVLYFIIINSKVWTYLLGKKTSYWFTRLNCYTRILNHPIPSFCFVLFFGFCNSVYFFCYFFVCLNEYTK